MFMELYKITANYVQYVVNKEESLKQLEVDLSEMYAKFRATSIRIESRMGATPSRTAWDMAGLEVEEPMELAVVMYDETYLVKVRVNSVT
jgi:hypothetical protein